MNLLLQLRQFWPSGPGRRTRPRSGRRTRCLRLCLEPLENRLVPSDGTGAGATLVKEFNPGSASSNILLLGDLNGTMLASPAGGLWKSDGTAGGTVLLSSDVEPESVNGAAVPFAVVG